MSENLKNTILRFAIVFVVIALLFVVVFVRIITIQTVQRDRWEGLVDKRESNYKTIRAIRGNIFDCDGRLLASSVPQYSIHMDTRVEALHMEQGELFWSHVDSIAEGLSRIIGDQTKDRLPLGAGKGGTDRQQHNGKGSRAASTADGGSQVGKELV